MSFSRRFGDHKRERYDSGGYGGSSGAGYGRERERERERERDRGEHRRMDKR